MVFDCNQFNTDISCRKTVSFGIHYLILDYNPMTQFTLNTELLLIKFADSFEGVIGKRIQEDVWKLPVVAFDKVPGKMPLLSEEQLKDTSRDQYLAYRLGNALESNVVPDKVVGATIGPPCHARWLTTAVRALRLALSVKRRTKAFDRILTFIVNHYLPCWVMVKNDPHIQSGARHLYNMLDLSRDLCPGSQKIVEKVLQDNSYFAHPENLVIACLADPREEIRRKAVLYIMAARRNVQPDSNPRQFLPPKINIKVAAYFLISFGKANVGN